MSLIGVNATANSITAASESSAYPSVTLTSYQMETIVSQLAAKLIWLGMALRITLLHNLQGHDSWATWREQWWIRTFPGQQLCHRKCARVETKCKPMLIVDHHHYDSLITRSTKPP